MLIPPAEERETVSPSVQARIHGGTVLSVAEIGIYQCEEAKHVARMSEMEDRIAAKANGSEHIKKVLLRDFSERSWAPWQYNQVVGWLRVFAYPKSWEHGIPWIGGEYYAVDAKRLTRNLKHKRFLWAGCAFGIAIDEGFRRGLIFERVADEINRWARTERLRNLHLDLTVWQSIGPHLDWP